MRQFARILRFLPRRMAAVERAVDELRVATGNLSEMQIAVEEIRSELRRIDQGLEEGRRDWQAAVASLAGQAADESDAWRQALASQVQQLREESGALRQALASQVQQAGDESSAWRRALGDIAGQTEENKRQSQVRAVMDWVEQASPMSRPLISVILPSRDRSALLRRALDSLAEQSYPHWEAIVVDDGSVDDTPAMLSSIGDERVKALRGRGAGACAARNLALEQAKGELIAYLDDDNRMHPQWLKTVVWAFEQHAEADVLYGAFIVDDPEQIKRLSRGGLPQLFFFPYDHKAVARDNIADMGCIAHRAGLPEAHFDEGLREMGDWDLFLRLTREKPPLSVPAVACFYTTDAPDRLSNGPTHERDLATVREKNRR